MRAAARQPREHAIRTAGAGDLDSLDGIEQRSFIGDKFPRRNLRRLLGSPATRFLIAEADGRAAGYAMILFRKGASVARLYSLAVDPDFRGRGIAESLIRKACLDALGRGAARLRLELRPSNAGAMRLYERAGFTFFERKPGYYADGEDAIRMDMILEPADEGDRSARL